MPVTTSAVRIAHEINTLNVRVQSDDELHIDNDYHRARPGGQLSGPAEISFVMIYIIILFQYIVTS